MAFYHCKTMNILKYTWTTAINVHDKDISVTQNCQIIFQHFVTFHYVVTGRTYFQSRDADDILSRSRVYGSNFFRLTNFPDFSSIFLQFSSIFNVLFNIKDSTIFAGFSLLLADKFL